jgi:hypothetical protein
VADEGLEVRQHLGGAGSHKISFLGAAPHEACHHRLALERLRGVHREFALRRDDPVGSSAVSRSAVGDLRT